MLLVKTKKITIALAIALAGTTTQIVAAPCESNFTNTGNLITGNTYKTFAELPGVDTSNAYQAAYADIAKEPSWKILSGDKANGVILLDKPLGYSSNQALQKVKWLYQAAKAGHTGTLDPLATGLLPICLGEATKFAQYVTDADKTYVATLKLGAITSTGDAEGEVLTTKPVNATPAQFAAACQQFLGEISQVPPMYSALKVDGKALYEYARKGVEIERQPRLVTIQNIEINSFAGDTAQISVTCSKGTYIRTLAEDIGAALGCGAHLIGLRRTETAGYILPQAVTIEQLEALPIEARDAQLLPVDSAISHLPQVVLNADAAYYLQQGQAVWQAGKTPKSDLRLYDENKQFLGLGFLQDDGKIAPKRLINASA